MNKISSKQFLLMHLLLEINKSCLKDENFLLKLLNVSIDNIFGASNLLYIYVRIS